MKALSLFSAPSSLAFQSLSTILNHPTFLPTFLATNRTNLIHHYRLCTQILRAHGIPYIPSNAGFFIWVDLTRFLAKLPGSTALEKEREMNRRLLDGGLHLTTSEAFYGEEYGWFRITFTVERGVLELALQRLVHAIGTEEAGGIEMQKLELKN
jgi:1-aminocyclopropane-1-carboxylate synthase